MRTWMLLVYNVPNKPTSSRLYVWRKLKKLGALLLHDAVWVLPATPHTREQLRWLASEVAELHGEATVWEARQALAADEDKLVARFNETVEGPYKELLAELKRKKRDLAAISRRYQQLQSHDYFNSRLGQRVRESLIAAKGE
jgi:hypothetical protein